jgi:predicted transcriptional regulator
MAATITLELPEALKARIESLAKAERKSPHAWMIEVLEERVAQSEVYAAFMADALEADREMTETRLGYAAENVHQYLLEKIEGKAVKRPKLIKI